MWKLVLTSDLWVWLKLQIACALEFVFIIVQQTSPLPNIINTTLDFISAQWYNNCIIHCTIYVFLTTLIEIICNKESKGLSTFLSYIILPSRVQHNIINLTTWYTVFRIIHVCTHILCWPVQKTVVSLVNENHYPLSSPRFTLFGQAMGDLERKKKI